jgi:hypothetical protein
VRLRSRVRVLKLRNRLRRLVSSEKERDVYEVDGESKYCSGDNLHNPGIRCGFYGLRAIEET